MNDYEQKAVTTTIKALSRASVKIRDNFYTIEYCEERVIPDLPDVDLEEEKRMLWDTVNGEVDAQIEDIVETFSKGRH